MTIGEDEGAAAFGDGFTWGVATAAYQIEGGWDADGKGPSIWDDFTHRRRSPIKDGSNGDLACDSYHRYREDVALVADLGFRANRFSTSWPRVLPDGTGRVNQAGLDYYSRVVDACLERGVEPWVTLFHWDLPSRLSERGGWTNRDVTGWFERYVGVMADALGDRVKRWMVFNEPLSFTVLGYLLGYHTPGVRSLGGFLAAVHHVNLAQAVGASVLRDRVPDAVVGTTQYFAPVKRSGDTPFHRRARRGADAFLNRLFVEPNLGLGYPIDDCGIIRGVRKHWVDGDDEAIRVDWDFLGVQYYTRVNAPPVPVPGLWTIPYFGKNVKEYDVTAMGWEVQPDGLHEVIMRAYAYDRFPSIVVTENGAAYPDRLVDGRVRDPRRVAFYQDHLAEVLRARRDGAPVDGYFCWSLLDNFEWADGYRPRFGIVHTDYATQTRTVKDSGRWFQRFLDELGTRGA